MPTTQPANARMTAEAAESVIADVDALTSARHPGHVGRVDWTGMGAADR